MNNTQLLATLKEEGLAEAITPGYNYCLMSLHCKEAEVAEIVNLIRERKEGIEATYLQRASTVPEGWSLLPYACVGLQRCVWVPIPFKTELNTLSDVLVELLPDVEFNAPSWS